jgi:hypothetical protein
MDLNATDITPATMLDGNAAAGILNEIFALEMTSSSIKCANCGG